MIHERLFAVELPSEQSRDREEACLEKGDAKPETTARSLTVAARIAKPRVAPPLSGPRAYFITYSCYGTWLHGDQFGSVDPEHNLYGTPVIEPVPALVEEERARMDQPPYEMDAPRREAVLGAIREVCAHRGWFLHAVHVRTTHVHVVVQAVESPEKVMNDFKSHGSRHLNAAGFDQQSPDREGGPAPPTAPGGYPKRDDQTPRRKRWTHHGSTRYLWNEEQLHRAIEYVLYQQGSPMAVFYQNRYEDKAAPKPRP